MPEVISLDRLTLQSLQRCLDRVSGISAGVWRLSVGPARAGGPPEALAPHGAEAAAVYLSLEGLPLFALMLVNPQELECLARAFTGHAFPRGPRVSGAEQVMLSELGNIILNAMLNPLVNSLKKSAMPTLPSFFEGPYAGLAAELAALPASAPPLRTVPALISLDCCGASASVHLFTFLPEDYALQIERA